ncbi:unnamed protein product [Medioppia subpectinata]|uniref:GATA zinc finger domain-containing protein 1 n=1 Tax=Medioppia subpectinata TaxID=1979941 RepID=A0A7R9KKI0_9ACAR|nr:unnamed protein product [Medioppia subpectinata]CAG2104020.1 unnamed protein product [Medioppia subpectinata]
MPLGLQPVCGVCGSNESTMWSKTSDGCIKCNDCNNKEITESNDSQSAVTTPEADNTLKTMPLGLQPVCGVCGSNESTMWSKTSDGCIKCNDCNNKEITESNDSQSAVTTPEADNDSQTADSNKSDKPNAAKQPMVAIRKSVRNRGKVKTTFNNKLNTIKGKSRRIIFKRCVVRGPTSFATAVTSNHIFFRGQYYQIGDIVSVEDVNGGTYFAQIRGFLQDQYCEKSAVITWLLPSEDSDEDVFDASTYFLGPEEDTPRKLECMTFVCHAPSDYYKDRYSPYPTLITKPESGFVWTRMGPQIIKISNKDQMLSELENRDTNDD